VITLLVVSVSATIVSTVLVVVLGARWQRAGLVRVVVTVGVGTVVVGEVVARWLALPSRQVLVAEAVLAVAALAVAWWRWPWNPLGVWFFANLVVAGLTYIAFAAAVTVTGGLTPAGMVLSGTLLTLETAGLVLAATFAFEICDVACRTRGERRVPYWDPDYQPFVSIHVAAYNEPPDMVIDTIRSLEALDYPNLEIVVVDNNTELPEVWKPVEEYCTDRPWVRFVHVAPWPGYKSGALNLALDEYTDPRAEVVGIVDADYLVDADWLADLVGWFADPAVAFVQTPQDYGDWQGDAYLTACHDAYAYFFATSMRSRNERNSPIFAGTMGLIRRSALEEIGGWDEWCITEDAEASLRILAAGYEGVYIHRSYGQGIMPLTFDALKRQRFRWCFGGIQILRKHGRRLVPWQRHPTDRLSTAQRLDFLVGGMQWGIDLVGVGFAAVLAASILSLVTGHPLAFRPFGGPAVVVPLSLAVVGALRAVWALRAVNGIGTRRALLAFANWLSLSLTVAYATARGIVRRHGVFLRTPKWRSDGGLLDALRATVPETTLAASLTASSVIAVVAGGAWALAAFAAWQAAVYATAPAMAWLSLHSKLSARLQRRQRTEERRERREAREPRVALAAIAVAIVGATGLTVLAATYPTAPAQPFELPERSAGDNGPLGNLGVIPDARPTPTTDPGRPTPSTTTSPTASPPTNDPGAPTDPDATTGSTTTTTSTPSATRPSPTPSATPPTSTGPSSTIPTTPTAGGPPTSHPGRGPG
jgi:cellulose synthase/poly-beta-1,6-N-acetylglucosamine synthase-like glycosyltransferase